jgi:predicted small lipoprotein YifL
MRNFLFATLLAVSLALSFAGCGRQNPAVPPAAVTAPTLTGDAAHPGQASGWVDTKLYFGLGPADNPDKGVSEAKWREFLDKEVTPRFPDGLSVVDVYGQWQGAKQTSPERLRSKMLIVDYPDTKENRDKVDAIRTAWKKMTGDQSVLRVTQPVDVSF